MPNTTSIDSSPNSDSSMNAMAGIFNGRTGLVIPATNNSTSTAGVPTYTRTTASVPSTTATNILGFPPPPPALQPNSATRQSNVTAIQPDVAAMPVMLSQAERDAISRCNVAGVLNTVPMFSGEPGTTPINHFIDRLKDAALMGNWSTLVLLIIFKQRLIGAALDYFNSNPHFTTASWQTLTTAFTNWFRNTPTLDNSLHAFFQTKQKHGESA